MTGVIAAYAALGLALLPMATEDDLDRRIRLACAAALCLAAAKERRAREPDLPRPPPRWHSLIIVIYHSDM